jgi:uncharacterized protein YndB with AHSA1/START domain
LLETLLIALRFYPSVKAGASLHLGNRDRADRHDTPREVVWRAWTDPEEVTKWWGSEGFTTPREMIEFDLRPGGVCRLTMVGPDGQQYPNDGHYGIVEPPDRFSFGATVKDNPMMQSNETTVEFIALDDQRTKVTVSSRMVCVEDLIDMANAGWNGQLDKLTQLLAS